MDQLSFRPISTQPISIAKSNKQSASVTGQGFKQQLQQAVAATNGKLTVSKHAQLRMNQRNIDINPATWSKIEAQIRASQKNGCNGFTCINKGSCSCCQCEK